MRTILTKSLQTTPFLFLLGCLVSAFQPNRGVTKEEAIKRAEAFIADNGYTHLPANKSKLSYEILDRDESVDSLLKRRRNRLHPKAFCISEEQDRWDIGFLSTSVNLSKLDSTQRQTNLPGRAVIVQKDGKEIWLAHKNPLFSRFEKL